MRTAKHHSLTDMRDARTGNKDWLKEQRRLEEAVVGTINTLYLNACRIKASAE